MNKLIIFIIGILLFSAYVSADFISADFGMANPSAVYCVELGYKYRVDDTKDGQIGFCVLPKGECEAWAFLQGKCGKEYGYCAMQGYDTITKSDGMNGYSPDYAVCLSKGKEIGPVTSLKKVDVSISIVVNEPERAFLASPNAPSAFDWRNYQGNNWMTPVKDQKFCNSCWAFSPIGTAEAMYNIRNNDPDIDLDLAEEYLVSDCYTGGNCTGGNFVKALEYMRDSGVSDEACMPYVDGEGCNCPFGGPCPESCTYHTGGNCSDTVCEDRCGDYASRLKKIYDSELLSPSQIKDYIANNGPVSAAMGMGDGVGGHWTDNEIYRCDDDTQLNHGIILAGYNDTGGYWIVKNSFGAAWPNATADGGYFKVGYGECKIEYAPFSTEIIGCQARITRNITLSTDLNACKYGLVIAGDNLVLDCNGHNITGLGNGNGILIQGRTNLTIKNCNLRNFNNGMLLDSSTNISLGNNNVSNNKYGISLQSSYSNYLNDNIIQDNTYYDVNVTANADWQCPNLLTNNTGSGNQLIGYFSSSVSLQNKIFSELVFCNADYSTISNVTIVSSFALKNNGLFLERTDNSQLSRIISNNRTNGIYLRSSSFNTLSSTNLQFNTFAVLLSSSSFNNFIMNNLSNNNYGIYLYNSQNNQLFNNLIASNTWGAVLESSHNNTISYNNASMNSYGLFMNYSSGNNLSNNNLENDNYGISLFMSYLNNISSNIFKVTEYYKPAAIYLNSSYNNDIYLNTITLGYPSQGIYLYNVSSNKIHGNTLYGWLASINLSESNNNDIFQNSLGRLSIDKGSNNRLYYNNVSGGYGITLTLTKNNILNYNNILNNENGLTLIYSSKNRIENNTIKDSYHYDVNFPWNYAPNCDNILENNTGSKDLPIKYLNHSTNLNGGIFSELILCDANYSNISNVKIQGSDLRQNNALLVINTNRANLININSSQNNPLLLQNSNYNNIVGFYSEDNFTGVSIYPGSNYNSVSSSYVRNGNGIYVAGSYNMVSNNIVQHVGDAGIRITGTYNNITNNTVKDCYRTNPASYIFGTGINIYGGSYNRIYNNLLTNDSTFSITLEHSAYANNVSGNLIKNSFDGIYLNSANSNFIENNNVINNQGSLSFSNGCSNNKVYGNNFSNNGVGLGLTNAYNNELNSNNIINNDAYPGYGAYGIQMRASTGNRFINNTISYHRDGAVYIWDSSGSINYFIGNTINNNLYGLKLNADDYLSDNTRFIIINNSIMNNDYEGISIHDSPYITISGNNISNNGGYGVHITGGYDPNIHTNITNNRVDNNHRYGLYISGEAVNIVGNSANFNNGTGIYKTGGSSTNNIKVNVTQNNATNNQGTGIYAYSSNELVFAENRADNNTIGLSIPTPSARVENNSAADNKLIDYSLDCNNFYYTWNNIGSGGRPIGYFNQGNLNLKNMEFSLLFLCGATYSNISNVTVKGSDTIRNNGIYVYNTNYAKFINVTSNNNYYGIQFNAGGNNNITGGNFGDNMYGAYLTGNSTNNNFWNNTFDSDNQTAYENNCTNNWNMSNTGNFWSDLKSNRAYPLYKVNGTGGGIDYWPISNNRPPHITTSAPAVAYEGQLYSYDVNATDPNLDNLSYFTNAGQVLPSAYTFDRYTGLFIWIPTYTAAGVYPLVFNVTDGQTWDSQAVNITVINVNRAPELAPIGDRYIQSSSNLIIDVNASDLDGENLTYYTNAGQVLPSPYSFNAATGLFAWTPGAGEGGSYVVTFNVTDGQLWDSETITIYNDYVACLQTIYADMTLSSDLNCVDSGLIAGDNSLTIDCAGHLINGAGSGSGIDTNHKTGISIKNCRIDNFNYGVFFNGGDYNELLLSNLTDNYIGVYADDALVTVIDSCIITESQYGIQVDGTSIYNNISQNTIESCHAAIMLGGSNTEITRNSIHDNSGYGVYVTGTANIIWNNSFSNTVNAFEETNGNNWASYTTGNYWSDFESNPLHQYGLYEISGPGNGIDFFPIQLVLCQDSDLDGYGNPASSGCSQPELDCNDNDAAINPGAIEICDNLDNNCDSLIDENLEQPCGSGTCIGTSSCSQGIWSECSTSNNDCGTCCICSIAGVETYDESQQIDCQATTCSSDGCGLDTCAEHIFADYPDSVQNYCLGLFSCSDNTCNAVCKPDNDLDQWSFSCGDCDDSNALANPGMKEDCRTTYDDNCNGIANEGCDLPGTGSPIFRKPTPNIISS